MTPPNTQTMAVDKIKPYPKNAKKHGKKQVEQVANSIREFGFNQPIVIDKKGIIIVGHGRFEAAKKLGMTEVPVIQINLSTAKANAYRLADNKLNESDWDMELVIDELKSLDLEGFDLSLTGFDPDLIVDEKEDDDETPEVPTKAKSKVGDVYQLGRHRIMCADATNESHIKELMNGETADMIFTDPPYGIDVVKNGKVGADFGVSKKGKYTPVIGDKTTATTKKFYEVFSKLGYKNFIIWGGNYFLDFLPSSDGYLIWDKRVDSGIRNTFADGEMAYCSFHTPLRIYAQLWNGMIREGEHAKRVHPTQKPIRLFSRIIEDFVKEDKIIVDPFGGSGTTLIASEKTGRVCYMAELDPKYVDVIVQRWCEFTGIRDIIKNNKRVKW